MKSQSVGHTKVQSSFGNRMGGQSKRGIKDSGDHTVVPFKRRLVHSNAAGHSCQYCTGVHTRNAHSVRLLFVMHVSQDMEESLLGRAVNGSLGQMHVHPAGGDVDDDFSAFGLVCGEELVDDDQVAFDVDLEVSPELVELHGQSIRVRSHAGAEDEDVGLADLGADVLEGRGDCFGFGDGCGVGVDGRCRVVLFDECFCVSYGGCIAREDGDVGSAGGSECAGDGQTNALIPACDDNGFAGYGEGGQCRVDGSV